MTGDKVDKENMAFAHLTALEMANKVRMLMRNDLEHEGVCVGARDRIMYLSQEVERLTAALSAGVPILEEAATRIEDLESENENLQIEHNVMFCRIRNANEGQYTPEEVSGFIDAEISVAATNSFRFRCERSETFCKRWLCPSFATRGIR